MKSTQPNPTRENNLTDEQEERLAIEQEGAPDNIDEYPQQDEIARPANNDNGRFLVNANGVFLRNKTKDGKEGKPTWLCSLLEVVAKTRDANGGDWGRLLQWRDADGTKHSWSMPMELLSRDGTAVIAELMRQGLNIVCNQQLRRLVLDYIQTTPVSRKALCVPSLGWVGNVFVAPEETIGESNELVVFQNAEALASAWSTQGTLAEWRLRVAALVRGNSRLMFAICLAFAATLIEVLGEESGGFHLRGASSSGKSTALLLAASVWGAPSNYLRTWRATGNGLEGVASLHNDGILILDELSQSNPSEVGETVYMLGNGHGKTRASRTGAARTTARWRLFFLSSGEESLAGMMQASGQRTNAGQEIRLADISADAGSNMGIFEKLHGNKTPALFAEALKRNATTFHGTAGPAWLKEIVARRAQQQTAWKNRAEAIRLAILPNGASGQTSRMANRFATVALAGELATEFGITGWEPGEATRAVSTCYAAWFDGFGGAGNKEERDILSRVRAHFEQHGQSRYQPMENTQPERVIHNRAGFYKQDNERERTYYVLPEAFKTELCSGRDFRAVTKILILRGWLVPDSERKSTQTVRLPGMQPTRCYVFSPTMWADET